MHGDREVSMKNLARHLGVKSVAPCKPETAQKHSGYWVGGTSPFGAKRAMPVYLERTILELDRIYINGGRADSWWGSGPGDLVRVLHPEVVEVAI